MTDVAFGPETVIGYVPTGVASDVLTVSADEHVGVQELIGAAVAPAGKPETASVSAEGKPVTIVLLIVFPAEEP